MPTKAEDRILAEMEHLHVGRLIKRAVSFANANPREPERVYRQIKVLPTGARYSLESRGSFFRVREVGRAPRSVTRLALAQMVWRGVLTDLLDNDEKLKRRRTGNSDQRLSWNLSSAIGRLWSNGSRFDVAIGSIVAPTLDALLACAEAALRSPSAHWRVRRCLICEAWFVIERIVKRPDVTCGKKRCKDQHDKEKRAGH